MRAITDLIIQTILTALQTHQTDGTQKSIIRGTAKGTTLAADGTFSVIDADHNAVDVNLITRLSGEDSVRDLLRTTDYVNSEIFSGKHFSFSSFSTLLNANSTYYWKITSPNTGTRIHLTAEITVNIDGYQSDGYCYFYENPTVNAAGTSGTLINHDRNSANVATAAVTYGDTSTLDGTLLLSKMIPECGTCKFEKTFILKQNEDYFVKFVATTNNSVAGILMTWYEE
jgi:hypothetical protein